MRIIIGVLALLSLSLALTAGRCGADCPQSGETSVRCAERALPGLRIPKPVGWRIAEVKILPSTPTLVVQIAYGPTDRSPGLLVLLTSYRTTDDSGGEQEGRVVAIDGVDVYLSEEPTGHRYVATLDRAGTYYQLEVLFGETSSDRISETRIQFVKAIAASD